MNHPRCRKSEVFGTQGGPGSLTDWGGSREAGLLPWRELPGVFKMAISILGAPVVCGSAIGMESVDGYVD